MILARLSNGKNESSTKLVDRVKTVAFKIILFRFCPYCDCNYIGARLWSSGLESKAANDAIFYWSIKQRSILRALSNVSGHDGFWMHPMLLLTLPLKETALKLFIKVLGSRVYKIENSFLKGTGTNWMGDNIKEFSNWWQNWSRISSHQVEGSWEKTIIFNLSIVRLDFRQARIPGKETVSAPTLPERKVQFLQDITRSMKAVQKARKSL